MTTKWQQEYEEKKQKTLRTPITLADIEKITDDHFNICKPMWYTINIYDSYEQYLKSAEKFTTEQRYLLALTWYSAEVSNGGHHQFFFNSTGIVTNDTLEWMKLFGMEKNLENFTKVVQFFGGNIPTDREQRIEILNKIEEKDEDAMWDFLDEMDGNTYSEEFETEFSDKIIDFIKKNPEKFLYDWIL